MSGHTDHSWAQHAIVKYVAGLKYFDDRSVRVVERFNTANRVMNMRIEILALGFDSLEALLREGIPKLAVDELETLAIFGVGWLVVRGERALEGIENGQKLFYQRLDTAVTVLLALFFDALAVILEVRLPANQRVGQLLLFGLEFLQLLGERGFARNKLGAVCVRGSRRSGCVGSTGLVVFFSFLMKRQDRQPSS